MGCIHQIVRRDLTSEASINFTIFTDELRGVILHCIDYNGNNFELKVFDLPQNGTKNIRITLNTLWKDLSLKSFCGCDPCGNKKIHFFIQKEKEKVKAFCNNHQVLLINIWKYKDRNKAESRIPLILNDHRGSMLVMLGNLGPYLDRNNRTVPPSKPQLDACLDQFTFNNKNVHFKETGRRMKSKCSYKCNENVCNRGLCQENYSNISCDCSSSPWNGRYCNNSLQPYDREGNKSFVKTNDVREMHLKMTWNYSMDEIGCLLEFVNRDKTVSLMSNKSAFIINEDGKYTIDEGVNFVNIRILQNELIYKINKIESRIKYFWYHDTVINVGFSEKSGKCGTFEGIYDFFYEPSQLVDRRKISSLVPRFSTYSALLGIKNNDGSKRNNPQIIIILISLFVILGGFSVFVVIIRLNLRNRKTILEFKDKVLAQKISYLSPKEPTVSNIGEYSTVVDDSEYGIIEDNILYEFAR